MRYVQINHRRISAAFLHSGAELFVAPVQMLRGKTRSTQGHVTLRFHERPLIVMNGYGTIVRMSDRLEGSRLALGWWRWYLIQRPHGGCFQSYKSNTLRQDD